jgi:mono/diheme cytochrome c family protein
MRRAFLLTITFCCVFALLVESAAAKNPIRSDFFDYYPSVDGTILSSRTDGANHCGLCHFDFNGGGDRNDFGSRLEALRSAGNTNDQAFAIMESEDMDDDGFNTVTELLDTTTYANTPTFPGYDTGDASLIANIPLADVSPYLVPTMGVDTDPPVVSVTAPAGGAYDATTTLNVQWSITDASPITTVELYFSDDGGASWKPVARGLSDDGNEDWFVQNRPGSNNLIRVEAYDSAGNDGHGDSGVFTINPQLGIVPTTFRDMDMPGTQPLEGPLLANPDTNCATCHGNYAPAVEPWSNWRGSMMSQAARDPLFWAAVTIAEQDAPSVGDLCIRCHSPRGWLAGRSSDTLGNSLTAEDRVGISCDFCHKLVDPNYVPGVSPAEDEDILNALAEIPAQSGNGQYVLAPSAAKRGPFDDALDTGHPVLESPFHRESAICGTCHDVSSPVFDNLGGGDYQPNTFDAPHSTNATYQMGTVERTYSEWLNSEFATTGVDIPQYGGVVGSCQDCHMQDVTGQGADDPDAPVRTDLPLHDFTGGATFQPLLVAAAFPGEVDVAQLNAAIDRARTTLGKAARIELSTDYAGVTARVINDTGHKLPSGYPEGRRIWLSVEARDEADNVVYTSGDYDAATGVLTHDADIKVYEIKPGLSPGLAAALALPAGPSFHFVLNDSVYSDNRIPPRGFTNAAFDAIQSGPVDHVYADGEYWDDTYYALPNEAKQVTVTLWYQALSKEYVDFLRDENVTDSRGQDLYDMWVDNGRGAPEIMAQETIAVDITTAVEPGEPRFAFRLGGVTPNPTSGDGRFAFVIPAPGHVKLTMYDLRGRLVRVLEDEVRPAGRYTMFLDGKDANGASLASGVYFIRLEAASQTATRRVTIVR